MIHAKFQQNKSSRFIGFAILSTGGYLGFSTRLNYLVLKPYSLIMIHLKFENHGCSVFREYHLNGHKC